jgi:LmbE family N-acetylglucosaminyl deacetylase
LARLRQRLRSYGRRTERAALRAWRRALLARSTDWTAETERRSCLVLAAHPDDETFACGATILRKTAAGTPVKVLIATDGRNANPTSREVSAEQLGEIRRAEALEACAILGVERHDVVQLAHAHLRSPDWLDDARRSIVEVIEQFRPDEILVNSALDYHPDHRAMNHIVRGLVGAGGFAGIAVEYPIWYLFDGPWAANARALAGRPTTDPSDDAEPTGLARAWDRVTAPILSVAHLRPQSVSCGPHLEQKRRAVSAYRSQVTNLTGEDTWGYLHDDFVSLFLQPQELLFPLAR